MAERLSRIIGTEEDKRNCPFYFKIGACRHGDGCSRTHLRPHFSQTLMIPHLYIPPPPGADGQPVDDSEQFEDFFEEIYEELGKFGEVEQLNVVENLGDHMFGNVYVKFHYEEDAEKCLKAMAGRYYAGRLVAPEYSPVTDFSEARCRQFDEGSCQRGGYCNFMHLKRVPRHLRKLMRSTGRKKSGREKGDRGDRGGDRDRRDRGRDRRDRRRDRSRSRDRDRDRSRRDRSRSRSKGKEEDRSMARSGSEERRAKIAEWNRQRDAPKEEEAPAAPAAEAAPPAEEAAPPAAEPAPEQA